MNRDYKHISIIILSIIIVGVSGHVAEAWGGDIASFFGLDLGSWITQLAAWFVNINLWIASWMLAITGFLLNFSVNATLNIKDFVDGTPAIFTVWKAIRDISGLFIIFTLLYAGIRMILSPIGVPGPNFGSLIKTVVVAGILINFSFFIAGLGIDVSNVISVQLYNAIAPANKLNDSNTIKKLDAAGVKNTLNDGGISDIFMQSLKITNLYDPKILKQSSPDAKSGVASAISEPIKIILTGVVGIVIIYTAAASFFLASLAFIVRFVLLLFLLAFSPIWFASFAIPQLKEYSSKWSSLYKGQLIFMPVYLLLMYFAMSILTSNTIFGSGYNGNLSNSDAWYANFLLIGVNAAMVIIMLNAPLLAAISLGAKMPKWAEKFGAENIWKKVGGIAGGIAGRNLIGRPMQALDKGLGNSKYGNKLWARDLRSATIGVAAKGKYGGSRSYDETDKEEKNVKSKQKELDRKDSFRAALNSKNHLDVKKILGQMNPKERIGLKKDLSNPDVIRHLSKKDFYSIKSSEDISDDDKTKIFEQRKEIFRNAAIVGGPAEIELVKDMLKSFDGKELLETFDNDLSILKNDSITSNYTTGQLKSIGDNTNDSQLKRDIAQSIFDNVARGNKVTTEGWIRDKVNKGEWSHWP